MDEAGKPMNGIYRFTVGWLMEEGATRPNYPADATLTVRRLPKRNPDARVTLNYLIDETGRITRCAVRRSSGTRKFDALACRLMRKRHTFAPARDRAGKAWPVARSQTVGFELAK
jgi:protein TonB